MIEGIGKVYLGTKEIVKAYLGNKVVYNSAPALDPDAEAFLLAASITDATITDAINNLVLSLKADSIWTKMQAIYPFVGGTASTHKFNLKDPRDLDAAFRLTFFGSPTHDANGVQWNGSSQYADTHLNENTILTLNNEHLSYYSRTNNTGNYGEIGCIDVGIGGNPGLHLLLKWSDGRFYPRANDNNGGIINSGTSQGLFVTNRTNSTQVRAFQNGVLKLINSNSIQKINRTIYIGALNHSLFSVAFYTNRECAFSSIGDGLTDTEAVNFYTAVQAFQTALTRNV
jgi:hypothetical protein